jgi:type I restriction enzyme M protein
MLDSITKKRIDDLRDILVGKIPSPQSQVEQITTGLIYKFMYDMDQEAVDMGGVPSFFVNDYEKYSWQNLFDPKLSGVQKVQLYSDAIEHMYTNPTAPQLFREIFKNSFLPFKDPATLNMFLKEINEFHYSHSEKLGDAFEYLLSFMGSQGDAGQFRTPRHIIDFVVTIINPQKNESILDPACGTAGFLISSYKHILNQNTNKKLGDNLTASDRKRLGENLVGYDISPDMTRISLVNMYLHQFASPQIHEYDTLSSEDRWNEYYDVILANPPFFSPTGGIQPHSRFGVQSTRAEVLFVDYIMEHLKPNGRAGIIVPEGIIFQTGTTYKTLRKKMVESCLIGVISLPAGVFQPYSAVKTSILIFDKDRNQKSESIFFANVISDGFSLATQRTPIKKNTLPNLLEDIKRYFENNPSSENNHLQYVSKTDVLANKDVGLNVSRYVKTSLQFHSDFQFVKLEKVCSRITDGSHFSPCTVEEGFPYVTVKDIQNSKIDLINCKKIDSSSFEELSKNGCRPHRGDILFSKDGTVGKTALVDMDDPFVVLSSLAILTPNETILPKFLKFILLSEQFQKFAIEEKTGVAIRRIVLKNLKEIEIPLPPVEIQNQIVEELESYQKIIDGSRQVIENYKPTIDIASSWKMIKLGDLVDVKGGKRLPKGEQFSDTPTQHPYIRVTDFKDFSIDQKNLKFITDETYKQISRYVISSDDVYISIAGTIGLIGGVPLELSGANLTENAAKLVFKTNQISKDYLIYLSTTTFLQDQIKSKTHAVGVPKLALERIKTIEIPIPFPDEQKSIIEQIKLEKLLVDGNLKLIEIYTKKIQDRISKVWGKNSI